MLKMKRSWLCNIKIMFLMWFLIMIAVGMLAIIFKNNNNEVLKLSSNHMARWAEGAIGFLTLYPVFVVVSIIPLARNKNAVVPVQALPYTNKQLFLKELKLWLIIILIAIVFTAYVSIIFNTNMMFDISESDFGRRIFYTIIEKIVIVLMFIPIEMQIVSAFILSFAKNMSWYKTLITYVVINMIVIAVTGRMIYLSILGKEDQSPLGAFIIMGGVILVGVISFVMAWRQFENINK